MNNKTFDLLVIGAGASGACVTYEAVRRGLKVALLDAGDISSGTSSRSTKLLHGGVRYLELAFKNLDLSQLRLVRQALLERHYWLQQAPFLAKRVELALPTSNCLGKQYYRFGLGLYDALSGENNIGNSHAISTSQLKINFPLIRGDLNGGVSYSDGQFNDARLNLLLALTAEKEGATIRNHCRVLDFKLTKDGKLRGAISEDTSGNQELWEAKAIVNATGINVDTLRQYVDQNASPRVMTSRGVHIVIKQNLCPNGIGLLVPSTDDGRVLFILPFFNHTQIGTTDISCAKEDAKFPSEKEKDYLIDYIKRWFPDIKDPLIKSSWAGGRPLLTQNEGTTNSSRVVREHEIEILPCGLISAMGGKWTTCRSIALDTLNAVESVLERSLPKPKTLPLIGTASRPTETISSLLKQKDLLFQILPDSELKARQVDYLQANYGLEALSIISKGTAERIKPLSETIPVCEEEIKHSIKNEHALTPTDILARRCRLAMVDLEEANRLLPLVNEHLENAGLISQNICLTR